MRYALRGWFVIMAFVMLPLPTSRVDAQTYCTVVKESGCGTSCNQQMFPHCDELCRTDCHGYVNITTPPSDQCGDGMGCSPGEYRFKRTCTCAPPPPPTCEEQCGGTEACICSCNGGTWEYTYCLYSPIVVDIGRDEVGSGVSAFRLTDAAGGVAFAMGARPDRMIHTAWTQAREFIAFLALDRNGDGLINTGAELFGSVTPKHDGSRALNGFDALGDLDTNLDGKVDRQDGMFQNLRLWVDYNHNGVSERWELLPLRDAGVTAIATQFTESDERDSNGNWYRYQGEALVRGERRKIVDVFFISASQ